MTSPISRLWASFPNSSITHPTKGYTIATGTIPLENLEQVSKIEHVALASAPQPIRPLLNYSADEIGALAIHKRTTGGATGKGVVVGMIDSGLEVRHADFYDNELKSRVIALWDQKSHATDGVAGQNGLGRVYSKAVIEQALADKKKLGTNDEGVGHGTLVAGVAVGDGSPRTCCVGKSTYIGIAPDAEIIAVGLNLSGPLGNSNNAIRALNFIFTHPDGVGRPLVVNISLGVMRGAHDGSTPFEKAIDAQTAARAHSVVVVAAGNFAQRKWHAKGTVPPLGGSLLLQFKIEDGDTKDRFLEVWYPSGPALNAKVIDPGNNVLQPLDGSHPDGILPPRAAPYSFNAQPGGARIFVLSLTPSHDNNDNVIALSFTNGARPKNDWTFQLINPSPAPIEFHAWLERETSNDDNKTATFVNPTSDVTISVPATAAEAIAVAAFENKTNCCDCFPSGDIASFSSHGPVRTNALGNVKPNIAAPGVGVTSANANVANRRGNCCDCCPDWCCCVFNSADGTSFAAPHVTGTVAMMFEVNPTLTRNDVATILHDTASSAPAPADPTIWGAGKLNAAAAVDRARAMAGGGPVPAAPRRAAAGPAMPDRAAEATMRLLSARIRAVPNGEAYAALISRHFSEVRRLINENQQIATMWHRGEGPRILRRLLEGAIDESAEAPVRTETQREYISRFLAQLGRYGSFRLKENIGSSGEAIVRLLERPLAAQIVVRA